MRIAHGARSRPNAGIYAGGDAGDGQVAHSSAGGGDGGANNTRKHLPLEH